jgi:putative DNA primase/helicase
MQADWFGTDEEFGEELDAEVHRRTKQLEEIEATVKELIDDGIEEEEGVRLAGLKHGPEGGETARRRYAERTAKPKEKEEEPENDDGDEDVGYSGPSASFANVSPESDDIPPFLSRKTPYKSAKEYVRRHCFKDGVLGVRFWNGEFWEWNGQIYEKASMEVLNAKVFRFLDGGMSYSVSGSVEFQVTPRDADAVIKCLKAGLAISVDPPCWVDGRKADGIIVFKNGIVDIATGKMRELTPKLWIHGGLDFGYDPVAKCEMWNKFLGEVFPGDIESRDFIEEFFGYGMTDDVRFHKAALFIGEKGREGKGTLAHIQEKLCGAGAYVSLSIHDWLRGDYSKEAMLGRKVGVFPDVRLREGKWYGANFDPGGIDHISKGWLLQITGGDPVTIPRKWLKAWRGVLPMKIIMLSNQVPNFNDTNLVSRFIKVAFPVSFRGREDINLRSKLEKGCPGEC